MKIYYIDNNKTVDLTPRFPELTKEQELKLIKLGITTILLSNVCGAVNIYAYDGISKSVQPIVDILVDAAEPVSYGFMCKGFFEWMSGKENDGKKTIKASGIGYLGIQFIPQIFKIIKGIKLG